MSYIYADIVVVTGYVTIRSGTFTGGARFYIAFQMRTELRHGLLFFAHGGSDVYWLMQLQDGAIHVEFGIVGLRQSHVFKAESISLCDGNWHNIRSG